MRYIPAISSLAALAVFSWAGLAGAQSQSQNTFTDAAAPGGSLPSRSAQGTMGGGFDVTPEPRSGMTPQEQADFDRFFKTLQNKGDFNGKKRCGPQDNGSYILCEPIPLIDPVIPKNGLPILLRQLYVLALVLAGSVAFIQIVRGGILYSVSGIVDGQNRAKAIFRGVAQGLALLMGSYVILNAINPALVTLRFPDADNYFPPVPVPSPVETALTQRIEALENFKAEEARRARETQDTVNALQDEIDNINADPNRTEKDKKRAEELQGEIYDQQDYYRQLQLRVLEDQAAKQKSSNGTPKGVDAINPNARPPMMPARYRAR